MRSFLFATVAGLLAFPAGTARADDEAKALIAKAIKAYGGEDKLAKFQGFQVKAKGTVDVLGMEVPFTSTSITTLSGKLKTEVDLDINNQAISVIQVYDGNKGWLRVGDNTIALEGPLLQEMREELHHGRVNTLLPLLKDKGFELKYLGDSKVDGKPVQGVGVTLKGFRPVELYFDKGTGLLAKTVRQVLDTTTMQEVSQETVLIEHKEQDGIKYASKAVARRDGKKYLEVEVTGYQQFEKVDDSQFARP